IVAAEIDAAHPGVALAHDCDVADSAALERLIAAARVSAGTVDLFCANAGIGGSELGLEASDDDWDQTFAINVRSHAAAARLLMPEWIERGEGYFLSTASAAGLLNVIGFPSYAVTKHGAVAFAEWLAI